MGSPPTPDPGLPSLGDVVTKDSAARKSRVLVVDLDGTLISTDLLWESFCKTAARKPLDLVMAPCWLLKGKPSLKRRLAERADLDVSSLPYRTEVLEVISARKKEGSRIVLATASDILLARRVADHLGLFDDVLASDGSTNCRGLAKLEAIRRLIGGEPFDYLGDSVADLPVVEAATRVWLVEPRRRLRARAEELKKVEGVFPPSSSTLGSTLRLLRPYQWVKNLLLFVPLIAGHRLSEGPLISKLCWALLSFSLAASAIYVVNDLCDLEADRTHERKKHRPLAAGRVPIPGAMLLAMILVAGSCLVAKACVSLPFLLVLVGYLLLTLAYSFWLKGKLFVDVVLLAGLYTYRVFAGGVATEIVMSNWLIVFCMFFFLSLALAKRYCELDRAVAEGTPRRLRGYRPEDVSLLRTLGPVAGFQAVMVLALYISSEATLMYPHRQVLWLVCPILLYWVTRLWFLAQRRELTDDPVVFALRDARSLTAGILTAIIVAAASWR